MHEEVQRAMAGVADGVGSNLALHPLQMGAERAAAGTAAVGAASDQQQGVMQQSYAKAAAAENVAHNLWECPYHMVDVCEDGLPPS